MRLRVSRIEAMASERPPGYVAAVMARGVIDGDWLEITSEALAELREIYRPERPEPKLPGPASMALRSVKAAAAEVSARLSGVPALDEDEIVRRLAVCQSPCDHWRPSDNRCSLCGCYVRFKARLRSQECPSGKW